MSNRPPRSAALDALDEEERARGLKLPGSLRELLEKKAREQQGKSNNEQANDNSGETSSANNKQSQLSHLRAGAGTTHVPPTQLSASTNKTPSPSSQEEDEEYEIDSLVSSQHDNGEFQYLIKWLDYPSSENTWEPLSTVVMFKELMERYKLEYPQGLQPTEREIREAEEVWRREQGRVS